MRPKINCHPNENSAPTAGLKKIVIVGSPNVGKSVLFNKLTGRYVTVSNYPGTTVEIARGKAHLDGKGYEVIDTPGLYTFLPITEEERVTQKILIDERPFLVLHVVEAKSLERSLSLTFELKEASLPTMLVLNMMDEAQREGWTFDLEGLENELELPVVGAVSTTGRGIDRLKRRIHEFERRAG